jgi:Tfp pilus assembly PilM family ATPase
LARFLALDWDHNQLFVVLGNVRSGKVTLERAASWTEERSPTLGDGPLLGKILRERLKAAGIPNAPVLACLGRDRVNVKEIRYPANVSANDEPGLVRFKAESELNQPTSEVVFDYVPLGMNGSEEKRSLLWVTQREVLATYQEMCQAAGLKLQGLTPRTFGLIAAGRRAMSAALLSPDASESAFGIVAVTERWAEFVIVQGNKVLLSRLLNVGPTLIREIQRNLAIYAGQSSQAPVRALVLTGVDVEPLKANLNAVVGLPVHLFEPFGGAEGAGLPDVNRGAYVAAVGLLQAQSDGELPLNFVRVRQPVVARDPHRNRIIAGVALAFMLLVAIFAFGYLLDNGLEIGGTVYYAGNAQQLRAINHDKEETDKLIKNQQDANKRIKGLEDWDGLSQVDEFYDITSRVPDVNRLQITRITVEHARNLKPDARNKDEKKKEYVDKYTIEGTLVDKGDRKVLDDFQDHFKRDGGYLVKTPEVNNPKFTLVIYAERRSPDSYKLKLPPVEKPKAADKGNPLEQDDWGQ